MQNIDDQFTFHPFNRVMRQPKNTVRSMGAWHYGPPGAPLAEPQVAAVPKPAVLRGRHGVTGNESTRTRLPQAARVDPNARFV